MIGRLTRLKRMVSHMGIARKPHVEVFIKRPRLASKTNLGFRERSIVSYSSFTYFQKHFSSCIPQACYQACSKVKGLQVFLRHRLSLRIITQKSAKEPRKVRDRSRRPSKTPALQAMGDDTASAIRCWSVGLG